MPDSAGEEAQAGSLNDVGLVIVHYRNEATLDATLECLDENGLLRCPTVVVDTGSDPDRISTVRERHPGVQWISLDNPGYGAAVNVGVNSLPADVAVIGVLTHEVRLERNTVDALVGALRNEPMTMVGPRLLDSRDGCVWSLGGRQSRLTGKPRHVQVPSIHAGGDADLLEAEWLDGALFMMRRADFARLGGMDENFFLYFEDVDFGWRLRRHHAGRVRVVMGAQAEQSPGGALDQYLATRNLIYLFWRQRRPLALLLFLTETICRLTAGALLRPGGARNRVRRRASGLVDGVRLVCRGAMR